MAATTTRPPDPGQLRLLDEPPGVPARRERAATRPQDRRGTHRRGVPTERSRLDPAIRKLGRRRVVEAKALVARLRAEAPWERECA